MINEREIELIHGEIDGANTAEESVRVQMLLGSNPEARALYDDLKQLAGLMRPGAGEELPRTLHNRIMNALPRGLHTPRKSGIGARLFQLKSKFNPRSIHFLIMEGLMKKAIIGGLAVAAVAVLYFATLYPWPGASSSEGTIGGVKKYNAGQIDDKDVKVAQPSNESATPAQGTDAAGTEFGQKAGVDNSQKAGLENSQKAGVDNAKTAPVENSQKAGLENSQKAGVDNSQKAGLENSQKAGLENSQKAGLENSQKAGLENSQKAGLENSQKAGLENSQKAGISNSQKAGVSNSQKAGVSNSQKAGVQNAMKNYQKAGNAQKATQNSQKALQEKKASGDNQ